MATEGGPNFEIPAEVRAFAEKSVEQAKAAFDSFVSAAQQAVSTAETHAATVRTGAKEAGDLAMRLAERNIASSFEFAQRLLHAKDPGEVASLHAGCAPARAEELRLLCSAIFLLQRTKPHGILLS